MHKHLGTGQLAAVVRVEDFASPVSIDGGKYVLLIASENPTVALDIKTARAWVDAGACIFALGVLTAKELRNRSTMRPFCQTSVENCLFI
jgi:hypothetical protein